MGIVRYKIVVSGRVQGVGYRMSAQHIADELGLFGWVKNLADGRVEIVAEGEAETLQQLVKWTQQGPSFAKVSQINVDQSPASGEFDDFSIR